MMKTPDEIKKGLALGNRPTCYCPDCGARMDGEDNNDRS